MVCQVCGSPVSGAFCSRCGAQVAQQPVPPPGTPYGAVPPVYGVPIPRAPRVPQHLQTLGILWLVFGVYRGFRGLAAALFLSGVSAHGLVERFAPGNAFPFVPVAPFMGTLAAFVAITTLIGAALWFVTGFALLNRKPWGRTLGIVAGALALFHPFLGTALGIYTLWVMAPSASGIEYDALADHS